MLLKLFVKIKASITFYSDEILYFKRVLIEIKAFRLKNNKLLVQTYLNTKPFIVKNYIFTTKELYWYAEVFYCLHMNVTIEIKVLSVSYIDEVIYFKGDLIKIKTFIIKKNTLFMQNYFKTKPFIIKKLSFWNKTIIMFYSDEVLYFKRVLIEIQAFVMEKHKLFMPNYV